MKVGDSEEGAEGDEEAERSAASQGALQPGGREC